MWKFGERTIYHGNCFSPRFSFISLLVFLPLFYIYVQSAVITMWFDCIVQSIHGIKMLLLLAIPFVSLAAIVSIFRRVFLFFYFAPILLVSLPFGQVILFAIYYFSPHSDHFVWLQLMLMFIWQCSKPAKRSPLPIFITRFSFI